MICVHVLQQPCVDVFPVKLRCCAMSRHVQCNATHCDRRSPDHLKPHPVTFVLTSYALQVYSAAANVSGTPLTQSYPSNSYLDDLFWAATWMLRASNEGLRPYNASYYYSAARTTFELAFADRDNMAVSADYVNNVALVHAATITKDWSFHSAAQSWVWDWICSGEVTYTTFGRAYHPEAPMLGDTALAAAAAATYVHAARRWGDAKLNDLFLSGACLHHSCTIRTRNPCRSCMEGGS